MLPEILTGQKNVAEWELRREELLGLFEKYEYGKTPDILIEHMANAVTTRHILKDNIVYEAHRLYFQTGEAFTSLRYDLYYHETVQNPIPAVLMLDVFDTSEANILFPQLTEMGRELFPYQKMIQNGYAAVLIHANDICEDSPARFERGIMEFSPRKEESDWGAIGAWSWGISRVVDELCKDTRIDGTRLALVGVSRAGKTVLWCGVQDKRIAVIIPVVSGCGGTAILRGKEGEHIRDMATQFPHWTCKKYAEYAECEEEFPVDQHMLIAMCAPRPIYLSDAIEDTWADPRASFRAAVLAGEVYALYGKEGLPTDEFPQVNQPLMSGSIAYHVREGAHGINSYDWEQYLTFLKRFF